VEVVEVELEDDDDLEDSDLNTGPGEPVIGARISDREKLKLDLILEYEGASGKVVSPSSLHAM